jgi:uncharacterized protein YndB with AHSA1/START domain
MTRIYSTITIDCPPTRVYGFVTTPGSWPQWHPSSLSVTGATNHSLDVGEQCTEEFLVAGRRGHVIWTVRERNEPRRWVIAGQIMDRDSGGVITYTLTPANGGTQFEREFVYPASSLLFRLLDALFIRRRVQKESLLALQQLKQVLEGT